jgi:glycosyltransferase involved in cell wall biosynthesis
MPELQPRTGLPKVTVAIPTLNRVGYLRLALESALAQTYPNIEVVVSNNASTDATAIYLASCTDPRLKVVHQTSRLPMTNNWNACLTAATGEYFLLLSDDDLLEPNAIRELVAGYANPNGVAEPGIVYCGGCIIDSIGDIKRPFKASPPREAARDLILAFFRGNRDLWFCGVLLRTTDVRPGFPTNLKMACDAAVWMRAAIQHGLAVYIPKSLVRYRLHSSLSYTSHVDSWRADNKQLLELVIAEDGRAGNPGPGFARRLRSVVTRVDRHLIIGRINQSFHQKKGRALLEYGRHLNAFVSPAGLILLAKGIISLFLNDRSRMWLKRKLRTRPTPE